MDVKYYKVFRVDICWDSYAANYIYVGAESKEDLLDHLNDIWPPEKITVHRESWMDDEDWGEECEWGEYKEGDVIINSYFTDDQIKDLKDPDPIIPRIEEVEHLYTDIPYSILDTFGYME